MRIKQFQIKREGSVSFRGPLATEGMEHSECVAYIRGVQDCVKKMSHDSFGLGDWARRMLNGDCDYFEGPEDTLLVWED